MEDVMPGDDPQGIQTLHKTVQRKPYRFILEPHKPVSSSTIARWLKVLLGKAGVNTEIFKAHSVRSASSCTLAAAAAGVTTSDILKVAGWNSETVF